MAVAIEGVKTTNRQSAANSRTANIHARRVIAASPRGTIAPFYWAGHLKC
jgi:hypothetical protein